MPRPDSPHVHPTAIVSSEARLAEDVAVGPFALIDGPVVVGAGSVIGPHVHLIGPLTLGTGNRLHTGCVFGDEPQHLAYKGEPTNVHIGNGNTFREGVTVHRGMPVGAGPGTGTTVIGNNNLFMVNSHVAHDCRVGNHSVFANGAVIGGHAQIADRVLLSGNTAVHQFCQVGTLALLGGTAAISQDLPPFWIIQGGINVVHGINVIGMRRAGFPAAEIQAVRHAYKLLNRSGMTVPSAIEVLEAEYGTMPAIRTLIAFIHGAKRGITLARGKADFENEV
ncbi:acyl-ACP--UDP-N-acetylglucosamine O-acyltransferase [Fimbriiglobus ruber]|uniref:Acyl-[acyl-carrier-protein]--UDP-N-acetylglucosamine O-acyltransferase n=1 Tax=Fimbriiglobus ruber TaxID=1908690 RepID=A0A225DAB3_9BACT|nr:acyl-ACP--UDP-N-acetylglucosamine O-acyltransferase [Fimbriiglobus ruber]OWK38530.1 Acyl-[acyl-carrier-protein]--UDP-N-acetylglucosamine O-acyltransferase [Fimbriiglobus ruber]